MHKEAGTCLPPTHPSLVHHGQLWQRNRHLWHQYHLIRRSSGVGLLRSGGSSGPQAAGAVAHRPRAAEGSGHWRRWKRGPVVRPACTRVTSFLVNLPILLLHLPAVHFPEPAIYLSGGLCPLLGALNMSKALFSRALRMPQASLLELCWHSQPWPWRVRLPAPHQQCLPTLPLPRTAHQCSRLSSPPTCHPAP